MAELRLGVNGLSGIVPAGVSSLTALSSLYLDHNQLAGPLPDALAGILTAKPGAEWSFEGNLPSLCGPPALGVPVGAAEEWGGGRWGIVRGGGMREGMWPTSCGGWGRGFNGFGTMMWKVVAQWIGVDWGSLDIWGILGTNQ